MDSLEERSPKAVVFKMAVVGPGPLVSPENLLEMQILGPYAGPLNVGMERVE